jgi:hypothetical protein
MKQVLPSFPFYLFSGWLDGRPEAGAISFF